jgi:predicted RNase H-like HicB family nuclease
VGSTLAMREEQSEAMLPRSDRTLDWKPRESAYTVDLAPAPVPDEPKVRDQLVERYVGLAVRRALVEGLEDGTWYAEVPLLRGVWVDAESEEDVQRLLPAAVRAWVLAKLHDNDGDIPPIESLDINGI